MISLQGAVHRSFTFPAPLPAACAYFGDFRGVITHLPHIRLVRAYAPDRFRVLYRAVELGVYDVRIYCDLAVAFDQARNVLRVTTADGLTPVKPRATLTSLTAQGAYQSTSRFQAAGDATQVDYRLELRARLPKPFGLGLISDRTVERIAHSIVMRRIEEIADGFIDRSIAAYRQRTRRRRTK